MDALGYSNHRALEYLEEKVGSSERSRSSYWDNGQTFFTVGADGTVINQSVLGNVSRKVGIFYNIAHWILQWPFRRMASHSHRYRELEKLGRTIASRQGRQFTNDLLRQVLSLDLVSGHVELEDSSSCNMVIGDGFGVLTSLLLMASPRKTILVNLTKPLLLDAVSIRKSVPEVNFVLVEDEDQMQAAFADPDVRLILLRADNALLAAAVPIALAFNIVSMQEMNPQVIADYFTILRQNPAEKTAFYCCNKLYKRLPDGTETYFMKYPWRDNDHILQESACLWSQWYYNKTPPFWHYRAGRKRVIWHRFAFLDKSPEPPVSA